MLLTDRLDFASEESGVETVDFNQHSDVVKRLQEIRSGGLDVAINCGNHFRYSNSLYPLTFAGRNFSRTKNSSA